MFDRRVKNIEIFRDTERRYRNEPLLVNAVKHSKEAQRFIGADERVDVPSPSRTVPATVTVSGKRSLEAAEAYAKQGKKVCVLNFASASNPGGGVVRGASAQEECICRCSTLYPCLDSRVMWEKFYDPHRSTGDPLHNDDCIYTPDVYVIKSDIGFPEPLPESGRYRVDILTCAAPNLRDKPSNFMNPHSGSKPAKVTDTELAALLRTRIRRIFEAAAVGGCDVLILGAFGCGAFRNPPRVVAKVFHDVMQDYLGYFEVIEYAVYHRADETENFEAFDEAMKS